jgi:5-oxoprolinase (ATP-hydrolysing)
VVLEAEDFMDDGTRISLRVTVDGRDGTAFFFFGTGTRGEVPGNCNSATCARRLNRALMEP